LRDRIDLWVTMPRVAPLALVGGRDPEGSEVVASRIAAARGLALERAPGLLNGRLTGSLLRTACALSGASERRVVQLAERERASGRGTERLLRVARTIADLAGDGTVSEAHLDEAAWFRPADQRLADAEAS
jgi:magnesium chelatase family protein